MTETFAILGGWTTVPAAAQRRDGADTVRAGQAASALRRAASRIWRATQAAHRLHQARRQLLALDDRLLSDAGIARHEIDAVIDDLARRRGARGG